MPDSPRKLLLFAATTGYQIRMFADAARKLGVEPVLASDRCRSLDDPWGDGAVPVKFDNPREADRLAAHFGSRFIGGIVAVGDRPAHLAALTAQRLGIPFHPPEAVRASGDKFLARERFRAAGLPVPSYRLLGLSADPDAAAREVAYPCVLKPLALSGSRGVIRADNPTEFTAAFRRIGRILRAARERDQSIHVEDYIEGREFALEGLVTEGRLQTLAIFDKPDPLEGPYFEETIYVTPSRESLPAQREIVETTSRAIQALGLWQGPVHAEMRCNARGVWMLEAAARPIGGLCAGTLRFDPEQSLEELIVRHATGEDVTRARLWDAASGVMMIPIPRGGVYQGVGGVERAAATPGVWKVEITAKQGHRLEPLPEGSSYLGFIFARAETAAGVERALRAAHRELRFDITASLPLVGCATGERRVDDVV
ncbi:MAG: ATP-grasp domain-containing protein [Bryobacteraceae bacterium]|nr:ATP-grasp domain-containing protein [Bryobacteraceae bacterium]